MPLVTKEECEDYVKTSQLISLPKHAIVWVVFPRVLKGKSPKKKECEVLLWSCCVCK